jgi:two-component system chemotaxis response regulator CheV
MATDILLDSGTNEVEILEFILGEQSFGINVAKVMQIIAYDAATFTTLPEENRAILGVLLWQGKTIPLIHLGRALKRPDQGAPARPIVLVTRFNEVTNGFLVSSVNKIHRVSWEMITPISPILAGHSSNITGSVNIAGQDILLVDFEYLVAALFPSVRMDHNLEDAPVGKALHRQDMRIVFAEDSTFIRDNIVTLLAKVGYTRVTAFENGQDAFLHIRELHQQAAAGARDITEAVNLVITDIEMPRMDGLTLCRKIKQDLQLDEVPVVLFSSLIDEQMAIKCREVGAAAYTCKPKINELIALLDRLLQVGDSARPTAV